MAAPHKAISVDQAINYMRMVAPKPRQQSVALSKALGRVLAEAVISTRDQPPFNASAMDGYAITGLIADEVAQKEPLKVVGESLAGRRFKGALRAGEAVRIFTGAPVPREAGAVVIQENVHRQHSEALDDLIFVQADGWNTKGDNIRPRGGDFKAGATLLEAGQRLDPWALSLVAAAGLAKVKVRRKLKIVVLSTGDELVRVGAKPKPDQIYESASFAIIGLIEQWGARAQFIGAAGDSTKSVLKSVKGLKADLLVTIGGASVGDYDLVKPVLKKLGLKLDFESVNVKPGKPTWLGSLADGTRVLGLPGNPASALVCAQLFLKPYIDAGLGRYAARARLNAKLVGGLPAGGPRESYHRAVLGQDAGGQLSVSPFKDQDSSLIQVFTKSNALVRQPAKSDALKSGDLVEVIRLDRAV